MKKTVIVEENSSPGCDEAERRFRVIRVKSTLTPRVGETLTARDVERLNVDRQMEVLIDLPRNGR